MARKENEKVGIFNCHGMGGNQVCSLSASFSLSFWFSLLAFALSVSLSLSFSTCSQLISFVCVSMVMWRIGLHFTGEGQKSLSSPLTSPSSPALSVLYFSLSFPLSLSFSLSLSL